MRHYCRLGPRKQVTKILRMMESLLNSLNYASQCLSWTSKTTTTMGEPLSLFCP